MGFTDNGGNYYISVRQLLQSEKKIEVSFCYSPRNIELRSLTLPLENSETHSSLNTSSTNQCPLLIKSFDCESLFIEDKNVIENNNGFLCEIFVGRFQEKNNYVKLLSISDPIEFDDSECNELIQLRDTGGLTDPSDLLY